MPVYTQVCSFHFFKSAGKKNFAITENFFFAIQLTGNPLYFAYFQIIVYFANSR
jgi:hypothetical protein